jgi:hypothetical protein
MVSLKIQRGIPKSIPHLPQRTFLPSAVLALVRPGLVTGVSRSTTSVLYREMASWQCKKIAVLHFGQKKSPGSGEQLD